MTAVMAKTYGHSASGFLYFWLNRALRLYPIYLLILAVTVAVLSVVGSEFALQYNKVLWIPASLSNWSQILTMLYTEITPIIHAPRLAPSTWALTLELCCYFLISIGATRTRGATWLWFWAGITFLVWAAGFSGAPRLWAYGSIPSAFVPFAIGGLLFHFRERGHWPRMKSPSTILFLSLGAMIVLAALRKQAQRYTGSDFVPTLIYLANMLAAVPAVVAAIQWRIEAGWIRRLDQLAGDASYPVYLAHWTVGVGMAWLWAYMAGSAPSKGLTLLAISAPVTIVGSLLCVMAVDRPINKIRELVRNAATARRIEIRSSCEQTSA